jgi:DNA-binding transcriptional MerR regulator
MNQLLTIQELGDQVRSWCEVHDVTPANGQAADVITDRTIRYYRTMGLLDPPCGGGNGRFSEKHRLQLVAIRLLQAQGLPLRRIRELLYGMEEARLQELERRGLSEHRQSSVRFNHGSFADTETWQVSSLAGGFLLVSRNGRRLPTTLLQRINEILTDSNPPADNPTEN